MDTTLLRGKYKAEVEDPYDYCIVYIRGETIWMIQSWQDQGAVVETKELDLGNALDLATSDWLENSGAKLTKM